MNSHLFICKRLSVFIFQNDFFVTLAVLFNIALTSEICRFLLSFNFLKPSVSYFLFVIKKNTSKMISFISALCQIRIDRRLQDFLPRQNGVKA